MAWQRRRRTGPLPVLLCVVLAVCVSAQLRVLTTGTRVIVAGARTVDKNGTCARTVVWKNKEIAQIGGSDLCVRANSLAQDTNTLALYGAERGFTETFPIIDGFGDVVGINTIYTPGFLTKGQLSGGFYQMWGQPGQVAGSGYERVFVESSGGFLYTTPNNVTTPQIWRWSVNNLRETARTVVAVTDSLGAPLYVRRWVNNGTVTTHLFWADTNALYRCVYGETPPTPCRSTNSFVVAQWGGSRSPSNMSNLVLDYVADPARLYWSIQNVIYSVQANLTNQALTLWHWEDLSGVYNATIPTNERSKLERPFIHALAFDPFEQAIFFTCNYEFRIADSACGSHLYRKRVNGSDYEGFRDDLLQFNFDALQVSSERTTVLPDNCNPSYDFFGQVFCQGSPAPSTTASAAVYALAALLALLFIAL